MADAFCLSTLIPIPVFNGDKYGIWSTKMKTYLRAHKLWDVVSNGYTVPNGSSTLTVVENKKLLEENQQRDNSALLAIQTSLTDEYFPRIERAETSKAAWDILKEDFQDNHKTSLVDEYFPSIERAKTSKVALDILKEDFQDNHKMHLFLGPDPFAAKMEFNVGTSSQVNGNRIHKSKNKKRDKERQKAAAADRDNTPPGSDIISGLTRDSELKDDSSSSKKRKSSNLNSEENMERGQKTKKRLF